VAPGEKEDRRKDGSWSKEIVSGMGIDHGVVRCVKSLRERFDYTSITRQQCNKDASKVLGNIKVYPVLPKELPETRSLSCIKETTKEQGGDRGGCRPRPRVSSRWLADH
jgi:hypothetical protein